MYARCAAAPFLALIPLLPLRAPLLLLGGPLLLLSSSLLLLLKTPLLVEAPLLLQLRMAPRPGDDNSTEPGDAVPVDSSREDRHAEGSAAFGLASKVAALLTSAKGEKMLA